MRSQFDYTIIDAINNAIKTVKAAPLILGGVAGSGGGAGGPPGGIVGFLPQYRVAYDTDELAISGFVEPGAIDEDGDVVSGSLLDNLNHIRWRISELEAGSGGGGASSFLDLSDTPASYAGFANKAVVVKSDESGLEFTVISGSTSLPSDSIPFFNSLEEMDYSPYLRWDEDLRGLRIGASGFNQIDFSDLYHITAVANNPNENVSLALYAYGTASAGQPIPEFSTFKSRGTIASPTAVLDDDYLLSIRARAYDSASWATAAQIRFMADGDWSTSSRPSRIEFFGIPSGSTARSLVATMYGNGDFDIPSGARYMIGGVPFSGGGGGSINSVSNAVPTGLVNGVNTSYTTPNVYSPNSLRVFLNGQRLKPGEDYYETSGGFVMYSAPLTGDLLLVDYVVTGSELAYGAPVNPDGWTPLSGVFTRIASELDGTFTVTIASPAVVTKTSHGLVTGQKIRLTTTGALPTGLATGTDYYVVYLTANTFGLASSMVNALQTTATRINTSGTQSGTHSLVVQTDPNYRLSVSGTDLSNILYEGMPIKFTQNSIVRYGWVCSQPSYSGGSTTFYVLTRCDDSSSNYDVLDTGTYAISAFYYGLPRQPGIGMPISKANWTVTLSDSNNNTQASPGTSTCTPGGLGIQKPIGSFKVKFVATVWLDIANTQCSITMGLTEDKTTLTEPLLSFYQVTYATTVASALGSAETIITGGTKVYALAAVTGTAGATNLRLRGDLGSGGYTRQIVLTATCDYL